MKSSRSGVRRGRRRQRRKIIARCLGAVILLAGAFVAWRMIAERPSSDPIIFTSNSGSIAPFRAPTVQMQNRRMVYPYSVVPGGVASPAELHEAADHDPVVANHYSGFDYQRAHVVEVRQPKLVYVSYRRGNKIFWTHKQLSLHVGEKLITDGHITARNRCGNQVSVLPQANTSPQEPTVAELDRPDEVASGMQQVIPGTFDSKVFNLDPGLPFGPSAPGSGFATGPFPGGFMPMPIAGGPGTTGSVTPPPCQGTNCNPPPCEGTDCNPPPPPPPPPPAVPEPGTLLLVGSGVVAVIAKVRRRPN